MISEWRLYDVRWLFVYLIRNITLKYPSNIFIPFVKLIKKRIVIKSKIKKLNEKAIYFIIKLTLSLLRSVRLEICNEFNLIAYVISVLNQSNKLQLRVLELFLDC